MFVSYTGDASVVDKCLIGAVIELRNERLADEPDRLSGEQIATTILGVEIPHFVIAKFKRSLIAGHRRNRCPHDKNRWKRRRKWNSSSVIIKAVGA